MADHLSAHYLLTADIICSGAWTPVGNAGTPFTGSLDGDNYDVLGITANDPGTDYTGLFGFLSSATISNLQIVSDNLVGGDYSGGLAGEASASVISNVHVVGGTVTGTNQVGGLFGYFDQSTLDGSSVTGATVSGSEPGSTSASDIGGALGQSSQSNVSTSYVTGTVNGNSNGTDSISVGGFVGNSYRDSDSDNYAAAAVSGTNEVGGFVGYGSESDYATSYTAGSVSGTTDVGGFVGYEGLTGTNDSFAAAAVSGTTNVGGLIGHSVAVGGDSSDSYFDASRTGQSNCVGLDEGIVYHTSCTAVNVANAQPNYFYDNTANGPFSHWDFSRVWRTTSQLPTLTTIPERPNNVRVVRKSNSLKVSWQVPAETGGSAITSYDLKYRPEHSTEPYTAMNNIAPHSTNSVLLSHLSANTWYVVQVRAVNTKGKGVWLGFVTSTLVATASTHATTPNSSATNGSTATNSAATLISTTTSTKTAPAGTAEKDLVKNSAIATKPKPASNVTAKLLGGAAAIVVLALAYLVLHPGRKAD